ncbi:unnamed protein product [Meganyctiphanes norvegica]|uniref:Uncharacterized protein n=1 Tax=Meganyctiphanes norvegica TaxID=48144 RepID=A0AAV2RV70_MEGNR
MLCSYMMMKYIGFEVYNTIWGYVIGKRHNYNIHIMNWFYLHVNIKLKCDKAIENAVKSYNEEMLIKLKSTKTEEDLQRFDEAAGVNANEKYKAEVSFAEVNERELYNEGDQKLKKALSENFETHKQNFNTHKEKIKNNCETAIRDAMKVYHEEMQKEMQKNMESWFFKKELQIIDKNARTKANKKYEDEGVFTRENDIGQYNEGKKKMEQ